MKIKSRNLALVVVVFIFGSVALTSALDLWKTTTTKVPAKYTQGEFAGEYNPADIRGSYTFEAINESFQVPLVDLGTAFGLKDPAQSASFQVKNLETMYTGLLPDGKEIGTDSVRLFVALYKGLPTTLLETISLPLPAVDVLKAKATLTPEQIQIIEKNAVAIPSDLTVPAAEASPSSTSGEGSVSSTVPPSTSTGSVSSEGSTENTSDRTVKGKTTFQELLDWGVTQEDIEKVLQDKMPKASTLIKDYATSKGVEFVAIKDGLQALIK